MFDIPFDLKKQGRPFNDVDPFNPQNRVEGYLCYEPDRRYGTLYITKVNGFPACQLIWATPKMHYPMDFKGQYHWVSNVSHVEVYEKLDGTNILQYLYKDVDGNEFVSYKTRMMPFVSDKGGFLTMWREAIDIYPEIPEIRHLNGMNVSYELYGRRNLILMPYKVPLDMKVLFGRGDAGEIITPMIMDTGGIGHAPLITTVDGKSDLVEEYGKVRAYLNEHLLSRKVEREITDPGGVVRTIEDHEVLGGLEGTVWYAVADQGTIQYKCKPDVIMDIHFKASQGLPYHSIYVTVVNAFEDQDIVTAEYVVQLLKEEFDESEIYKKLETINKLVLQANLRHELKNKIMAEYRARQMVEPGFDINKDKGAVMRYFSGHLAEWGIPAKNSGKVYQLLMEAYGRSED